VSTPSQIATYPEPGSPPINTPVGVTGSILNQSVPAGVGARFAATLLDGLIVGSGYLLTMLVHTLTYNYLDYNVALIVSSGAVAAYVAFSLTYYVGGWGQGQTLGKKALRIRVVDVRTGRSIGYGRAFGRLLMLSVMALPCYLGYLSIFGADGRGWHDKATDSWAVRSI
jgi:uncharacterized RDD family membrane protein YckC